MAFEVERAREWYAARWPIARRDRKAQRAGLIMAAIYRTLLDEIARDGYRVLDRRTSLTPVRKLWIAWRTAGATRWWRSSAAAGRAARQPSTLAARRPVMLYETAPVLGGRARRVERDGLRLDNGQHMLLGAYDATLELLARSTERAARARLAVPCDRSVRRRRSATGSPCWRAARRGGSACWSACCRRAASRGASASPTSPGFAPSSARICAARARDGGKAPLAIAAARCEVPVGAALPRRAQHAGGARVRASVRQRAAGSVRAARRRQRLPVARDGSLRFLSRAAARFVRGRGGQVRLAPTRRWRRAERNAVTVVVGGTGAHASARRSSRSVRTNCGRRSPSNSRAASADVAARIDALGAMRVRTHRDDLARLPVARSTCPVRSRASTMRPGSGSSTGPMLARVAADSIRCSRS